MFYERKIKYLDYLVRQDKQGNAGFVKLEVRGEYCNITINVSSLERGITYPVKVYLIGEDCEEEICTLELVQGRGTKQILGQALHNLGNTGIPYHKLKAIRIPIVADCEIYGVLGQPEGKAEEMIAEAQAGGDERDTGKEEQSAIEIQSKQEELNEIYIQNEQEEQRGQEEQNTRGELHMEEAESTGEEAAGVAEEQRDSIKPQVVPLCDDKWKQLWAIYPHISPFRDEREYLSIGPGDFVILPGRYFRMANNSFLLHGYYNYKHLILKKIEYQGQSRYYVGVPGNFYDREKQVAVMFGFESFESLEDSAQVGDYGYYLMRVEL